METINLYTIYAYVDGDGLVQEITVWSPEDLTSFSVAMERAKILYGSNAFIVDVSNINVRPGYKYIEGTFYKLNTSTNEYSIKINRNKTFEEIISDILKDINDIKIKLNINKEEDK